MAVVRAPEPAEQPVGALVSRLGTDLARILRAEIALAQLRLTTVLSSLRGAGVVLVTSALLAIAGVGAVVAGLILVIAHWMPAWVSALVVGGILLVTAGVLAATQARAVGRDVHDALAPVGEIRGH